MEGQLHGVKTDVADVENQVQGAVVLPGGVAEGAHRAVAGMADVHGVDGGLVQLLTDVASRSKLQNVHTGLVFVGQAVLVAVGKVKTGKLPAQHVFGENEGLAGKLLHHGRGRTAVGGSEGKRLPQCIQALVSLGIFR